MKWYEVDETPAEIISGMLKARRELSKPKDSPTSAAVEEYKLNPEKEFQMKLEGDPEDHP